MRLAWLVPERSRRFRPVRPIRTTTAPATAMPMRRRRSPTATTAAVLRRRLWGAGLAPAPGRRNTSVLGGRARELGRRTERGRMRPCPPRSSGHSTAALQPSYARPEQMRTARNASVARRAAIAMGRQRADAPPPPRRNRLRGVVRASQRSPRLPDPAEASVLRCRSRRSRQLAEQRDHALRRDFAGPRVFAGQVLDLHRDFRAVAVQLDAVDIAADARVGPDVYLVRSGPIPASESAAATLTLAGKPNAASRADPLNTFSGAVSPVTVIPF